MAARPASTGCPDGFVATRSQQPGLFEAREHRVARVHPQAVHGGEPRVPQPHEMMKERRGPVCGIGEPEMVPARVEKPFEQLWTLERLRLGRPVPIVCGRTTRRL